MNVMQLFHSAAIGFLIGQAICLNIFHKADQHRIEALEKHNVEMQQDLNEKAKTGLLRTETVNRYSEGIQDQVTYIYHHFNLTQPEGLQPKENDHALVL